MQFKDGQTLILKYCDSYFTLTETQWRPSSVKMEIFDLILLLRHIRYSTAVAIVSKQMH